MGVAAEKSRQSCWCWTKTGRQLAPVKAGRCHAMFNESNALSRRLHKIELDIKALKKAADTLISDSEKTMAGTLIQDYHVGPEGNVAPVPNTGAPLIAANQMSHAKDAELKTRTYDPISAWQTEHTRLMGRVSEVDKASLLLDEARRKYYKASQKELKENVMKQDNVSASQLREAGDPRLVTAREAYMKIEAEVHEELLRHSHSSRYIQTYITQAMDLQGERLIEASRVHARPLTGAVGATAGVGAAASGLSGRTGELHQPAAGGAALATAAQI